MRSSPLITPVSLDTSQPKALKIWLRALKYFDLNDLDRALYTFEMAPRTPKIFFNLGILHLAMKDIHTALTCFEHAVELQPTSALYHLQVGVCHFYLDSYDSAHESFAVSLLLLENQPSIDFGPSGLDFCLYSAEVLFNCALCLLHLGRFVEGGQLLALAREERQLPSHVFSSFDIFGLSSPSHDTPQPESELGNETSRADYWNVFQVPNRVLYRPMLDDSLSNDERSCHSVISVSPTAESYEFRSAEPSVPSTPLSAVSPSFSVHSKLSKLKSLAFFK